MTTLDLLAFTVNDRCYPARKMDLNAQTITIEHPTEEERKEKNLPEDFAWHQPILASAKLYVEASQNSAEFFGLTGVTLECILANGRWLQMENAFVTEVGEEQDGTFPVVFNFLEIEEFV